MFVDYLGSKEGFYINEERRVKWVERGESLGCFKMEDRLWWVEERLERGESGYERLKW